MLVAEKQEQIYYPQQGLQAALPKQRLREQPKAAPKSRVRAKSSSKVMPIVILIVMFAISCLAIARYAIINQNHQDILDLEKTLKQEESRQQNLRVELARKGNLDRIEKVAKEDLGMDYPTKDQVQVVSLPDGDSDITVEIENVQSSRKTIFEHIINIFN